MEAGSSVVWTWEEPDLKLDVEVEEAERNRRLAFAWSASGVPTRVLVEFEARDDATTQVTVREEGWENDAQGIARYGQQTQGWVHMLACLKAFLEYEKINLRQQDHLHGLEKTHYGAHSLRKHLVPLY